MIDLDRRYCLQLAFAGATGLSLAHLAHGSESMPTAASTTDNNACKSLLSHRLRPLMEPETQLLCDHFANQVLLIVNTASQCGFTPQFAELETLQQRYAHNGFQVLGFPSGDFRQELKSEKAVANFCKANYGVTFPMFEKISVTGESAHPLYKELAKAAGTFPRWNFNKYLINRNAEVIAHYNSGVRPLDSALIQSIESLL